MAGFGAFLLSLGKFTAKLLVVCAVALGIYAAGEYGALAAIKSVVSPPPEEDAKVEESPKKTRYVYLRGDKKSAATLLSIRLNGPILGHPGSWSIEGYGGGYLTYGYHVKKHLLEAAENSDVKGVLLHVSTPGGHGHRVPGGP